MEVAVSSPAARGGRGYQGPATWDESHPVVPDEFVFGYLKGRGVTDALAESVAREAGKAFRDSPFWHATAGGRTELILRLHWTLLDGGHTSQSSKLTGDLMKELLNRWVTGADRITPP
jgi:hypothetical protein